MAKKITHEEFLDNLTNSNNAYKEGKFKVISKFINSRAKVQTKDKYGICKVNPINLYKGTIPSIITAVSKTEYCINQFKEVHGDRYNYELVNYISAREKVEIICNKHGTFKQAPHEHLLGQGCYECVRYSRLDGRRLTNDTFIKKAIKIHDDTYSYVNIDVKGNKQKVNIVCKVHGNFMCSPNSHLKGRGCRKCYLENNGYNRTRFTYFAKNKECTLYLIRCWNESEEFFKVGITSRGIKKRFSGDNVLPYNYEILKELKTFDSDYIWDEEVKIKKEFKNHSYQPNIQFKGYTECFNIEIKEKIINYLKEKENGLLKL